MLIHVSTMKLWLRDVSASIFTASMKVAASASTVRSVVATSWGGKSVMFIFFIGSFCHVVEQLSVAGRQL